MGYLAVLYDNLMVKFVVPVNQKNNGLNVKQSKCSYRNEKYCRQVFYLLLRVMTGKEKKIQSLPE